ncbi:MAG: gamma-glutamyltransferase [Acidimicrobiia bacterium]
MTLPGRLAGARVTSHGTRVAVTPHHLASRAAIEILDGGGNAADAAVAANATLGVVAPETCGIGGDLFALIQVPGRETPAALNSSGHAGAGARAEMIRGEGLTRIPVESPYAVTVPGCVDGWEAILEEYGSLPLSRVLETPVALAESGFPASPQLARALEMLAGDLRPQPASAGLYSDGTPPAAGALVTRPTLAATLRAIAAAGREAFYAGDVGDGIVSATAGVIDRDDLARRQADWIDPIPVDVLGWTGWTIPPNSQGYLTLAAAWLFENLDPPHDPTHPRFTHAAIEAYRAMAWERDRLVCDDRFSPIDPDDLLDTGRLEERLSRIDLDTRTDWPTPPPAPGGTAFLCVRDDQGMGISLIQSNYHGIGSRIGVGDHGFFLHDRGSGFTLEPGHPNEIAPGKRPLHTLSPTLWTLDGSLQMLLGTRGGDFQPQTLLQMVTYMRWAGLDGATAQLQPRWTTAEWRTNDPGVVFEPHLDTGVVEALREWGHHPRPAPGWMPGWGPVSVITGHGDGVVGAADPRVAATAALS